MHEDITGLEEAGYDDKFCGIGIGEDTCDEGQGQVDPGLISLRKHLHYENN